MVEDRGKNQQPRFRRGARHQRMRPESIVPAKDIESGVFDLKKSGLLKIWLCDTPSAREIFDREVVEQVHHHAARGCVTRAGVDWLDHEMIRPWGKRLECCFADRVERKDVPLRIAQSGEQRGA